MDMKCATCQEPWEHHHLLHELPGEIWDGEDGSESEKVIEKFKSSDKTDIPKELRAGLEEQGWKFGRTIVCVLECCCCASNVGDAEPEEDVQLRIDLRMEAEAMLGRDLDGLISTLQTIDMYAGMSV